MGSTLSVYGVARLGSALSVLDYVTLGSAFSLRSLIRGGLDGIRIRFNSIG